MISNTPLFNYPCHQKTTLSDESQCSIFSNNQDTTYTAPTTVMDLFSKYKETLDENKKLENNILELKTQLMNLNAERTLLKKRIEIVNKFISSFQEFPCTNVL